MEKFILLIKGFIIGIANIIPGVSGGTIMMSLGIYEDIIHGINSFASNIKRNITFLFTILVGALISLALMSRVIDYALDNYIVPTIIFFIGLIIGSFPMLIKNVKKEQKNIKCFIAFIISFLLVISLNFIVSNSIVDLTNMSLLNYFILFIVGIVSAGAMIIPGLSGSFMLILFGYYESIMEVIKNFTSFENIVANGIILFVFVLGMLVGLVFVIKLIDFLLDKYKVATYYAIIGFVSASVISILITNFGSGIVLNLGIVLSSIVLFITGFIITYKLGD